MPVTLICSECGGSFRLRDEMAGRKVRCPDCDSVQIVPALDIEEDLFSPADEEVDNGLHPAFRRDLFLFRQKVLTLSEKYVVWDEDDRPILYIERPAYIMRQLLGALATIFVFVVTFGLAVIVGLGLSEQVQPKWIAWFAFGILLLIAFALTVLTLIAVVPKRHISFYADESKADLLLQVLQDQKFQFFIATYTVVTPEGECLGRMKKNYLYDFFRKKWEVLDPEGRLVLFAREDSLLLSMLRRFLGPQMGFLRTNFILLVPDDDGLEVNRGEFNRQFTVFDRYVLDLDRDDPPMIDRRLAVALGVLLDTGEHR